MAATGDKRIESATFLTTQVDFTHAGDLKVFVDEEQIQAVEAGMKTRGYLEGSRMANAFNMLRPNDLIWPYVVNVYLKGQAPFPFDLLYWNSDSTRMPAANHSFYLRNCYLENKLTKGEMALDDVKLDLKKVTIPIFNLAAREDHIAPARSVFVGSQVLRRAGRLRARGLRPYRRRRQPAGKPKYQFWTGGPPEGELEDWIAKAERAPRLLVAVLVRVGRAPGAGARAGPRARRRQAQAARRRAGRVRQGEGVGARISVRFGSAPNRDCSWASVNTCARSARPGSPLSRRPSGISRQPRRCSRSRRRRRQS